MGETTPLRVAVIGVGHLGRHHARILGAMDGVKLVAVVDADKARGEEIATANGTVALQDISQLGEVDAVTVAVPTEYHATVALPLLKRGIPALIEKPLARSLDEADALIAAAKEGKTILGVGHTERFNPAVNAAMQYLSKPGFVEVHRLGTFPERSLDIDVVFDLMIHDIDVLHATVGTDVVQIEAVGVPVLTPRVDIANVRLKFASGCIANLTASRISRDRIRKVRFFQPHSYLSIDYATQELEMYRLNPAKGAGMQAIEGGKVDVTRDEPLKLELQDFVNAVRTGGQPRVTGEAGRKALELAQRITDCMTPA
jgi:predicted dehydrogenase